MLSWFCQASGISISMVSVIGRPASCSSSATSSRDWESEAPSEQIG